MNARKITRTAVVLLALAGVSQASAAWAAPTPVAPDRGTTILSSCRAPAQLATGGLLSSLVLVGNPAALMTCLPAGIPADSSD
ncbi:hypothetical protein [Streptomyces sp. NPDC004232]|uniref:hypothetical protein n=1 Tax=unclassified Streptomyces TaxID=2593676 RepID=UPI001D7AFEB2|nr:hypothetical protein [Streptomyces sp. tea 10]